MNGRKSRESIGSPNTLERRSKRYSYSTTRQTSVEVPYARLLDSPSKKILRQESADSQSVVYRRGSDSNKSQNNTLRVSPPKTSISDSRLTGEVNVEDDLEVRTTIENKFKKNEQICVLLRYPMKCPIRHPIHIPWSLK